MYATYSVLTFPEPNLSPDVTLPFPSVTYYCMAVTCMKSMIVESHTHTHTTAPLYLVLSSSNAHSSYVPSLPSHDRIFFIAKSYNNFKFPVTISTTLLGPGPMPSTVALPLAICVLPASCITLAHSPKLTACACSSSISSSLFTCTVTLA